MTQNRAPQNMPAAPSGFILGIVACILGLSWDKGKGLTREFIVIHKIFEDKTRSNRRIKLKLNGLSDCKINSQENISEPFRYVTSLWSGWS
jgi:hypothetical protein